MFKAGDVALMAWFPAAFPLGQERVLGFGKVQHTKPRKWIQWLD